METAGRLRFRLASDKAERYLAIGTRPHGIKLFLENEPLNH